MPPGNRKDGSSTQRADKESKRARGAMSCAECRRLKLKCDKTVPCSSCKRRGCSAICPNGSLITGQGTRFVLADTEKLHQKIATMSDRIRQLEDAVAVLHSSTSANDDTHPLLQRDLLKIKSIIELHSAVDGEDGVGQQRTEEPEESQAIDAFGTLAIRDDGAATFYGRSAGSESLLIGEATSTSSPHMESATPPSVPWQPQLPKAITNLSSSFPLASSETKDGRIDLEYLSSFLPPWQEAYRLCELYLETAPWFFGPVTERQLQEEILPMWYSEAPLPPSASSPSPSSAMDSPASIAASTSTGSNGSASGSEKAGAHELALLFVIFCFGSLTDISLPPAPDNPDAERYFQLTRAAFTLEPVTDRPPSVATVQALSLLAIYQGLCSGENSIEATWAMMGLSTKLAQSIGLHRDCARWKLSPAEVQKRRALFWELFVTDCWQSLATGRLATFSLPFVDAELPQDPDQTISDDGTIEPSFPYWKARFGAECVSAVVQGTLTSRAPKYTIILELDRKVRDMELPKYAQGSPPKGAGLRQTMLHFMPSNYRELTLLYIHRCFFTHAISSHPRDPIKSSYAPSFLAGYRSACALLRGIKVQFELFPAQIARFWVLWTHAFSATIMISSVVTNAPECKVAPAALLELNTAFDLFSQGATYGGRAVKFLPIIQRIQEKAQRVYMEITSGMAAPIPRDIFRPSSAEDEKDDMSIFSGKTHTEWTKAAPKPPRRGKSSAQSNSTHSSPYSSQSPPDMTQSEPSEAPAFANAHPNLVAQFQTFDGQITAQIQNGYHQHHEPAGNERHVVQSHVEEQFSPPYQPQHQMQQADSYQSPTTSQYDEHHLQRRPSSVTTYSYPNGQSGSHGHSTYQYQDQHPAHREHAEGQSYTQNSTPENFTSGGAYNQTHSNGVVYESQPPQQYWANQSPSVDYYMEPEQQRYPLPPSTVSSHPHFQSQQSYHHSTNNGYNYTPDGALRGIAAEDHGLQETWKTYMSQYSSPAPR